MNKVDIAAHGEYISITLDDAHYRFHAIWLRDNAQDENTRNQTNGQRLIGLHDIASNIVISQVKLNADSVSISFMPEKITLDYPFDWLIKHSYDHPKAKPGPWLEPPQTLWDAALMGHIPEANFDDVCASPLALQAWLEDISKFGFAKLNNGPVKAFALTQVVDLFGYIRETNYGRIFEVQVEEKPTNLAFTGLKLQAHTDNPYRDPVPSVQVLYCLESSAAGGENILVDGFMAATLLYQENPHGFNLLCRYCARFEYAGEDDVILQSRRPLIELAGDGQLQGIRFNNRSAAPFTDIPFEHMADYYAAYRRLSEIINDNRLEVSFRLNPGDCFVIDNTRVLHAREAFSGSGTRWLQGCYADIDGLKSRLKVLQKSTSKTPKD